MEYMESIEALDARVAWQAFQEDAKKCFKEWENGATPEPYRRSHWGSYWGDFFKGKACYIILEVTCGPKQDLVFKYEFRVELQSGEQQFNIYGRSCLMTPSTIRAAKKEPPLSSPMFCHGNLISGWVKTIEMFRNALKLALDPILPDEDVAGRIRNVREANGMA